MSLHMIGEFYCWALKICIAYLTNAFTTKATPKQENKALDYGINFRKNTLLIISLKLLQEALF